MIDAGPSLKAAEGLDANKLAKYLVERGWAAMPSRMDGVSIFSKKMPGSYETAEIILPSKKGFGDEDRRVADALRTVAQIEGRSESAIAEDARSVRKVNKKEGASERAK